MVMLWPCSLFIFALASPSRFPPSLIRGASRKPPAHLQAASKTCLGGMMWDKPKVLFLCTGHPERSEMAEGFLRNLAGETMITVSATVEPAPLSPLAVDALNEVGIDLSHQV